MLEYRILGPLQVLRDGVELPLTAAAKRQLLVALLLQANTVVSTDGLVDALWDQRAPQSARKLVQVYVSQLRAVLGPDELETVPPGYRLLVAKEHVDAERFERLSEEAQRAIDDDNPQLARVVAARALALWRGPPLADIPPARFAVVEAARLDELKLGCELDRIAADLALGRASAAAFELRTLCTEHPLRDRVRGLLARALYASGRQAESLDVLAEGRRALRDELGLEPSETLRWLERAILNQDPSLIASPSRHSTASAPVPRPTSSLIGRQAELEQLRALVGRDDVRIVTLSGAGGSGKTRLALELVRVAGAGFANGAAFVELAAIRDPKLVLRTVADALAVPDGAGEAPARSLARWLGGRELLLVLDNFEQVVEAASDLATLATETRQLTIVVTSRRVLHVSGEHVFPVEPLREADAARLFVDRAHTGGASTSLDVGDAAVRAICRRLDGLPLAIELAAGRTRSLTPRDVLSRLEPHLQLLSGGPRDLPARQRTLRATLAWSFELLDDAERRDLCRLSVFPGGCTLDAATLVCGATTERLSTLVDSNLLRHTADDTGSRYTLLETVREHAAEQLAATGETEPVNRRLLEFLLGVAESANLSAEAEAAQRHHLVVPERDNIRAALNWAIDARQTEIGLRLAVALENFWVTTNPLEGLRVLGRLLESSSRLPLDLRARTLRALGGCSFVAGDYDKAERLYEDSLTTYRALGDERGIAILSYRLGMNALERGDPDRAQTLLDQSLKTFQEIGSQRGETQTIGCLAAVARATGNVTLATTLFERSATMSAAIGRTWWETRMLTSLGELALDAGHASQAAAQARRLLRLALQIGDRHTTIVGLAMAACAAATSGDGRRAGRLWGAVEADEARGAEARWHRERDRYRAHIFKHDDADIEQGRTDGRHLSLDAAISEALSLGNDPETAC